jgi:hypothetical protein
MAVDWAALRALAEAALVEALTNPAPNYSINGESVSYADYIRMLREQLAELEKSENESTSCFQIKKRGI